MAGQNPSFSPLGAPLTLSAVASSVNGVLPGVGGDSAKVTNTSTTLQIGVKFATADQVLPPVAALSGDFDTQIFNPGESRVVAMPYAAVQAAVIGSAAGPTTVYIQRGSGGGT